MRRIRRAIGLILIAFPALAGIGGLSSARAEEAVDLELVLAVDISGSVDFHEARLQRDGYVAAMASAEVAAAVAGGVLGRIAVAYVEWAGGEQQSRILDWRLIDGPAAARAFAEALAAAPQSRGRYTSIAAAILFALPMFDGNGFTGTRRVIDISGDGPNNTGPDVTGARDRAVAAGITINGLPIVNDRPEPFGGAKLPDLDAYYRGCVVGGPGAFIVVARDFPDFARAVRRKLVLEIAGARPREPAPAGPVRLAALQSAQTVRPWSEAGYARGCDIGERMLRDRLRLFPMDMMP